jgi:hypothetical protein
MGRAAWIVNRVAAALVGAALVGFLAAVIGIFNENECSPGCIVGTIVLTVCWSLAFGTLPGIAALTLTPARQRPWRSLPLLVLGTLVGFMMWFYLVNRFSLDNDPRSPLFLFLFPTLTGFLTAFNLDRLTPRRARVLVRKS